MIVTIKPINIKGYKRIFGDCILYFVVRKINPICGDTINKHTNGILKGELGIKKDFENSIICGDWIDELKKLPDNIVHCCVRGCLKIINEKERLKWRIM